MSADSDTGFTTATPTLLTLPGHSRLRGNPAAGERSFIHTVNEYHSRHEWKSCPSYPPMFEFVTDRQ